MRAAALGFLLALFLQPPALAEKFGDLKPQGYVNDFAGVLDAQTKAQITALCAEIDQKAHAQIAVATIRSLDDIPIEDFANKLYARWGIGYKGEDRGVLILLALADRKYKVEVGYGLEPILPDGKVGGFGREVVPNLREGDYNGALLHLTASIAQVIASDRGLTLDSRPHPQPRAHASHDQSDGGFPLLIVLPIFFVLLFAGLRAAAQASIRGRGRWGSGWGGWYLGGGGWGGGGFGGFGGGGFGGFGGGISGGGGASGSW